MTEKRELANLVKQAQKGDPDAFGRIYDRFYERVYAYVFNQVGARADAEDITAGVFLDALQNIGRFSWRGAGFGAWLFRIARNDVLDHFRKQGRQRDESLMEEATEQPSGKRVEDQVGAAQDERILRQAIKQLSEEQQQVLLLKLQVNFSNKQIGEVLSKSEGAVKALQHRALLALRKTMTEEKDGNDG